MARKKKTEAAVKLPSKVSLASKNKERDFKRFLYATYMTPEEQEIYESLEHDDLRHEEKLLQVRILRLLKQEAEWDAALAEIKAEGENLTPTEFRAILLKHPMLEVDEILEKDSDQFGYERSIVRRRRDIHHWLLQYVNRLVAVRKVRAELTGSLQSEVENDAKAILTAIERIKGVQNCQTL